jgi:hypothetical protein
LGRRFSGAVQKVEIEHGFFLKTVPQVFDE